MTHYDAMMTEARTAEYMAYSKAYAVADELLNAYHAAIGTTGSAAAREAYINACDRRDDAWMIWQASA